MKKSILNLGKTLNKTEQKLINGGVVNCPDMSCYYGTPIRGDSAPYCGTCSDFYSLPLECQYQLDTSCGS